MHFNFVTDNLSEGYLWLAGRGGHGTERSNIIFSAIVMGLMDSRILIEYILSVLQSC